MGAAVVGASVGASVGAVVVGASVGASVGACVCSVVSAAVVGRGAVVSGASGGVLGRRSRKATTTVAASSRKPRIRPTTRPVFFFRGWAGAGETGGGVMPG